MLQVLVTFFAVTIPDSLALVCFLLLSTRRMFYSVGKVPLIFIVGCIARFTQSASRFTHHVLHQELCLHKLLAGSVLLGDERAIGENVAGNIGGTSGS
jgi:hypothetical protein